jgi:hypothetical protein
MPTITPTEATRIAKWLQVLLIILQAFGATLKVVPKFLVGGYKAVKRR